MPKRCPKCKTLNSASAPRCVNPACEYAFSPDAPVIVMPVTVPPVPPPDATADRQAQRDAEFAEVRALVGRLEAEVAASQRALAERQSELERLKALAELQQRTTGGDIQGTATTPTWMAKALVLAAAWPRLASTVAAVMALGAGYGGVSSCRNFLAPGPAATEQVEASLTAPDQTARSTALDDRDNAVAKAESEATGRENRLNTREKELNTRETSVQAREIDLAAKEKSLKTRADELAAQATAAGRAEPRMGYFDFELPRGNNPVMLTRGMVRGTWPSRDCVVVSVSPLDRDEIPPSFASLCRADRIVLDRPRGPRRVRVVWMLN